MAIISVIPLLVICVTGSILVFKHEIDWLLIGHEVRVDENAKAFGRRQPFDQLLQSVSHTYPNYETVGWVTYLDPGRADQMYLMEHGTSEWSYLLLDQYSGTLLSEPRPHDHWFTDWLLELHFNLLLDDLGLLPSAMVGIVLFLLGVTGIILYRNFWKTLFLLRWNARLIVYFSDLHKTVGILSSPVLLILAFTGVWWNISAYVHEMQEHADGHEHPLMTERLYSDQISIDDLISQSRDQVSGFEPTYLSFPYEPGVPFTFWGDVPSLNILASEYSSTVSFDAGTGEHLGNYDIREASLGGKILDSYRRLHFGDFAGLFSRTLWAVLGLSPLLLSITGLWIWWKRKKKKRKHRNKKKTGTTTQL